mmetsp:Transcript_1984/g.5321  ORF Transcript_1984/g.5321 Transcript_1984/m.5321 type:complete len:220 (-) Transcript_1984:393-1052(-)
MVRHLHHRPLRLRHALQIALRPPALRVPATVCVGRRRETVDNVAALLGALPRERAVRCCLREDDDVAGFDLGLVGVFCRFFVSFDARGTFEVALVAAADNAKPAIASVDIGEMDGKSQQVASHFSMHKVIAQWMVPLVIVKRGPAVKLEPLRARVLHDQQRVVVQTVPWANQFVEIRHQPGMSEYFAERFAVWLLPAEEAREVLPARLAVATQRGLLLR